MSALLVGAFCARGVASCTYDETIVIPPMGYDQQVCLSIASPIDGACFELPDPVTQTIPVTLELNSTFALRPPGSCSTNALNNCGHAIYYVNGQCATRSAGLITDISLRDFADPYGKVTITALLVDDCDNPWTLLWDDAGVIGDGGIMCLPQGAGTGGGSNLTTNTCPVGLPPAPPSNVTNTCPEDANADASVNAGPYFASVTINVQPTCPGGGTSTSTSTSTSVASSTGAGTGGASASSSASGMGGASSSASGMGGASSSSASGMGGASSSSASGMGGASSSSSSASGMGGASSSSASGMGGASTTTSTSASTSTNASTSSSASGMGGASSSASGAGGGGADAGDGG